MIASSLLVPSTPLLLPGVGAETTLALVQARAVIAKLSRELRLLSPQTLVVVCESATAYPNSVTVLAADPYNCSLLAVGDLGYKKQYHPDFGLVDSLQRKLRRGGVELTLDTEDSLPIEMIAGLDLLTANLNGRFQVVPIVLPKFLSARETLSLGEKLIEIVDENDRKTSLVITADLDTALLDRFSTILSEKSLALFNSTFADRAIDQTLGAGALGVFLGGCHLINGRIEVQDIIGHTGEVESLIAEASFI